MLARCGYHWLIHRLLDWRPTVPRVWREAVRKKKSTSASFELNHIKLDFTSFIQNQMTLLSTLSCFFLSTVFPIFVISKKYQSSINNALDLRPQVKTVWNLSKSDCSRQKGGVYFPLFRYSIFKKWITSSNSPHSLTVRAIKKNVAMLMNWN